MRPKAITGSVARACFQTGLKLKVKWVSLRDKNKNQSLTTDPEYSPESSDTKRGTGNPGKNSTSNPRFGEKAANPISCVGTGTCLLTSLSHVGIFSGSLNRPLTNVNLKNKTTGYFPSKRWAHSGMAENCNPGQASDSKTIGNSGEQRRETLFFFFYKGKVGRWEGYYK